MLDRDYVINNFFGGENLYSVKNAESMKRLIDFSHECLSEEAPLSQGYYFNRRLDYLQFLQEIKIAFLQENYEQNRILTIEATHSIRIIDKLYAREINISSFDDYDLLFITNYYHYDRSDKRHGSLYHHVSDVAVRRGKNKKRTFILSLAHDVGPDKYPYDGFLIPMFPIKEKIREVLDAKANGKNPW